MFKKMLSSLLGLGGNPVTAITDKIEAEKAQEKADKELKSTLRATGKVFKEISGTKEFQTVRDEIRKAILG